MTTRELYFVILTIVAVAIILVTFYKLLNYSHHKQMAKEHEAFIMHLTILKDVLRDAGTNPEYVMNQYLALIKYCNENEFIFRRIHENLYEVYKEGQYVKRRGSLLDLTRYLIDE